MKFVTGTYSLRSAVDQSRFPRMEFFDFLVEVSNDFPGATLLGGNLVVFDYEVPLGGRAGQNVRIGLMHMPDWPLSCPPGPHVSPRIGHPDGNVHDSPLGQDWEYWSRPFPNWADSSRTFREYMAHIRALFMRFAP